MAMNGARCSTHGSQQPSSEQSQPQRVAHQYPPQASSSRSRTDPSGQDHRGSNELIADYLIHTETQGVIDVRLQISVFPAPNSTSKASTQPVFFRERALTENNEIVDSIVDARSGRVCWTVHRPTRGWYLYLRSPSLPSGAAISLTSAKTVEYDASISPLTFSLTSVVQEKALAQLKTHIEAAHATSELHSTGKDARLVTALEPQDESGAETDVAVATGRENAASTDRGHARKRSAAGSGTHSLADRKQNRKSLALAKSPMIPEAGDEGDLSRSSDGRLPRIEVSAPPNFRADADLPYSPAKPDNHSQGGGRTHLKGESIGAQKPRLCTFVLCDGSRRPRRSSANTEQPLVALQGQQSWTRWVWSILPQEMRPELPSGTNKNFSVYWIDPSSETGDTSDDAIEMLRFEDQSGWWMWNSQTRGKLTLQTKAIEALGFAPDFWITLALAYVQFLEERDSYEAAFHA